MSNKKDGTALEEACAKILHSNGFWVHLLQQNKSGQPADIIAVNHHGAFLIDAKNCADDKFPLRRVENNQISAMTLWNSRCNENTFFFIRFGDGIIYAVKFKDIAQLELYGHKTISEEECGKYGLELGRWIEKWS